MNSSSPDGWLEVVDPVVKGIVGKKFRVSLSKEDRSRANQKALDTAQNIYLELTKALEERAGEIQDLKSYAAVVSYTECAKTLGGMFPERKRLKNKVRYFLTHEPGFAVWETKDGDLYCGYAGWTRNEPAAAAMVNALVMDPSRIPAKISFQTKALDSMNAVDWKHLVDGILDFLGGPVELDDVVAITGSLFHVKDEPREAAIEPSVKPRPEDQIYSRTMFKWLWQILQDFEHRWLMAFLLNLPGYTKEARGEIEAFEASGAASRQEIGRLLGLTEKEYQALKDGNPQAPADPRSPEDRMVVLWPHLPLEDVLIAKALECQKQQVINLRDVARQKAAKKLREKTQGDAREKK